MKLYLITNPICGSEQFNSMVVLAKNAQSARLINPFSEGEEVVRFIGPGENMVGAWPKYDELDSLIVTFLGNGVRQLGTKPKIIITSPSSA